MTLSNFKFSARRLSWMGPLLWIASFQYFIIQFIVAADWPVPYSWLHNTISDLGNTMACASYDNRFVCSPLHNYMNLSFAILGITMFSGAILIYLYRELDTTTASRLGFGCLAVAGVGTLLVGIFPENTISGLHVIGASLPFLLGNIGLLILGNSLKLPSWLKVYTLASGSIALVALVFFITGHYYVFGNGGIERLVAYPQTVWLIIFGMYLLETNKTPRPSKQESNM